MWIQWIGFAFAIAVWDWFAVALSRRRMGYFTKPAVMLALLGAVFSGTQALGRPSPMLSWVAVALFLSMWGDIFLMLPRERFTWGLAAFLTAHVAYLIAFSLQAPRFSVWSAMLAVAVGLVAGKFYERLRDALEASDKSRLIKPVAAYITAISLMLLSALLLPLQENINTTGAIIVALGAILFFASDGVLAWHRFIQPISHGRLWTRILYHLGQIAITTGALLINIRFLPTGNGLLTTDLLLLITGS